MSGGLTAGRDQILPFHTNGAVSRVVLISDGLANEGTTDPDELSSLAAASAEYGVSVTTVGVGLDFDEQLMTRLAVSGTGSYYFVEHSSQLASMFANELGKLGNAVGTEVGLVIEPAAGVQVLDALGYDLVRRGGGSFIAMPDMHAGETRKVVLRLRVQADAPGAFDIASFKLSYRSVDAEGASADVSTIAFASRGEATRSITAVEANTSKDAVRHIERARTSQALQQATELYERGEVEKARGVLAAQKGASAKVARIVADESIVSELAPVMEQAEADFKAASGRRGSAADKRARKGNRKKAYDLAR